MTAVEVANAIAADQRLAEAVARRYPTGTTTDTLTSFVRGWQQLDGRA